MCRVLRRSVNWEGMVLRAEVGSVEYGSSSAWARPRACGTARLDARQKGLDVGAGSLAALAYHIARARMSGSQPSS